MLWQGRRESSNVEDDRNEVPPTEEGGGGFSLMSLPVGGRTKLVIIAGVVLMALITGGDPIRWLNGDFTSTAQVEPSAKAPTDDNAKRFVAVVLADTEDVWTKIFQDRGKTYTFPKLVLFRRAIQSGCGVAGSAMGPFYCPEDQRVYLDLDFLASLQKDLNAPGDFAEAYVIAHEVGHHVQQLLGQTDLRHETEGSEGSSVRTELQADCYAGIWAHYTEQMEKTLEPGDIDQALNAASAVGDDRLQKREQGYAVPDSFTHGTSQQRQRWFKKGYQSGELEACDTFAAPSL